MFFALLKNIVARVFWTFWVFACRVVERWSSAAANCTERGRAACFDSPSTEHSKRFYTSREDASKLVASGMTERGAGAVRCNDLFGIELLVLFYDVHEFLVIAVKNSLPWNNVSRDCIDVY